MVPQQPKYPPWVRRPIQPILMSIDEQHHGQPHEDEEADMEGESDEVEQDEGQHHEIEQDEMVASQGHEVIHAYKARPIQRMLSGAASSGAESWHGPHENSDEFEHEEVDKTEVEKDEVKEEVESEMNSDDYEHYIAESVEPEHFQCFVGDKPVSVVVYDLSSVPNNQLVAELARRLGD